MDALQKISESCMKNELPSFEVGDTVRVQVKIKEGDKERLQAFEGTVIGIKKGGINSTFTVRRISHGCGVESTGGEAHGQQYQSARSGKRNG